AVFGYHVGHINTPRSIKGFYLIPYRGYGTTLLGVCYGFDSRFSSPYVMVITSLLDTDLYKFTMMQVVLHQFPAAQVEYKYKCRTSRVSLRPYLDEIRDEIRALCSLRFTGDELAYLRSLRFIKSDFVDFLELFHLHELFIPVSEGEQE